jgi:methyl-accepting chemotaxis protein
MHMAWDSVEVGEGMNRLVERFSIRTLLYSSLVLPLTGVVVLAGVNIADSYRSYGKLEKAQFVETLASAGGELAQALPSEAFSKPEQLADARKRTDAAFKAIADGYAAAQAVGIADATIAKDVDFVRTSLAKLSEYRGIVDNPGAHEPSEVMAAGLMLQPVSAAGIDLMRRAGAMINDLELSRVIHGYHALMQVNDAGLIEYSAGRQFIGEGKVQPFQQAFTLHSRSLFAAYTDPMIEYLPQEITAPFVAFQAGEDNAFMKGYRDKMYQTATFGAPDAAAAQRWDEAGNKRAGILREALGKTSAMLDALSKQRLADAWNQVMGLSALIGVGLALSIFLSLACVSGISGPLRRIVGRMTALADGDTMAPVPYEGRSDEIGQIARSVAHFRSAAIDKERIQAEAEAMRANTETERLAHQRQAEAEADRRLAESTGALASGLKRLANGDMLCEIHEHFAPQFEQLRHDFNTSVSQLRDAFASVGRLAIAVDNGSGEISNASDNL